MKPYYFIGLFFFFSLILISPSAQACLGPEILVIAFAIWLVPVIIFQICGYFWKKVLLKRALMVTTRKKLILTQIFEAILFIVGSFGLIINIDSLIPRFIIIPLLFFSLSYILHEYLLFGFKKVDKNRKTILLKLIFSTPVAAFTMWLTIWTLSHGFHVWIDSPYCSLDC